MEFDTSSKSYKSIGGVKYEFNAYLRGAKLVYCCETIDKSPESAVAGALECISYFHKFVPRISKICTDDDPTFSGDLFQGAMREVDIEVLPHAANAPYLTGGVERMNQDRDTFVARCLTRANLPGDFFRSMCVRHWINVHNNLHIGRKRDSASNLPPVTLLTGRSFRPTKHVHAPGSRVFIHDIARASGGKVGDGSRTQKHDCKITEALYVTWMDCGTGIIVWDIGAGRLQRVAGQAYSIVPLTPPRQHPLPDILPMIDGSVNIARLPGLNWNQTSSINAYKRGILTLEALPASERNRMLSRYARKKVMTHESIARTKEKSRIEIIQENGKSRGLNKSERITMIKTTRQYRVNRSTRTHLLSRPRMVPRRRRPSQEVDE